ncbi:peroxide stress protein YaaA [Maribellus maritimus]|uniref:peroxide stress protein YaaA n=1 Tax=Maribellus maritimus TaxID=2870838 RepID=UPI001EEBA617|nr:peroxide stress protein YaaA [Maribellus maritimus]MCG6187033.1 peroxide stress protein YaaA [Maribellus maritimus]
MLIVVSPAKSLNFETPATVANYSIPELLEQSEKLIGKLKKMSPGQLSKLMNISKDLGELNYERYQNWILPFNTENAKQAVLAFNGDVYQGLSAATLSEEKLELAQKRMRILSGLYGVLKPLDLIQAYRLEMGTKLKYYKSDDLYSFWNPIITRKINEAVAESGTDFLINLASNEYFKSIDKKKLKAKIITPEFKDLKNGQYKMISFFAKKARGLMTRFILDNDITEPENLQAFDYEGYLFNSDLSKPGTPVFTRDKE